MAQSLGTFSSGSTTPQVETVFASFKKRLATGDLLTGTPTVTTESTGITIASVAKNTAKLSSLDGSIVAPINTAVQWKVTTGRDINSSTEVVFRVGYATTDSNSGYMDCSMFIDTSPKI